MLAFSRRKTRSTPYSWSWENLTKIPTGPARFWLMTRFFLPRTCPCSSDLAQARLPVTSMLLRRGRPGRSLTHAFKEGQQVPPRLVLDIVSIRPRIRRHGCCGASQTWWFLSKLDKLIGRENWSTVVADYCSVEFDSAIPANHDWISADHRLSAPQYVSHTLLPNSLEEHTPAYLCITVFVLQRWVSTPPPQFRLFA